MPIVGPESLNPAHTVVPRTARLVSLCVVLSPGSPVAVLTRVSSTRTGCAKALAG
jgi:hypothetical protein